MEKRLSLAELKAKASETDKVLSKTEVFTGGMEEYCHFGFLKPLPTGTCHKS